MTRQELTNKIVDCLHRTAVEGGNGDIRKEAMLAQFLFDRSKTLVFEIEYDELIQFEALLEGASFDLFLDAVEDYLLDDRRHMSKKEIAQTEDDGFVNQYKLDENQNPVFYRAVKD